MDKKNRILVIDDDNDIVTFLTALLEDNGYATIQAFNGEEGLQKTKAERPDLVLLDISMPEKSGVKYYREVRDDPELKSIPVVIVTGVAAEFKRFISTRRQVPPPEGYISKPVDKQELLDTISVSAIPVFQPLGPAADWTSAQLSYTVLHGGDSQDKAERPPSQSQFAQNVIRFAESDHAGEHLLRLHGDSHCGARQRHRG